jgi:hypothetical protein
VAGLSVGLLAVSLAACGGDEEDSRSSIDKISAGISHELADTDTR